MTNTNTEKKTLTERVQEELIKRLTDAEWHKITINMKKSGHDLTISPCAQTTDINKLEDIEVKAFARTFSELSDIDKKEIMNLINFKRRYKESMS